MSLLIIVTFQLLIIHLNMNIHIIPKNLTASQILAKNKEPYTEAYDSSITTEVELSLTINRLNVYYCRSDYYITIFISFDLNAGDMCIL